MSKFLFSQSASEERPSGTDENNNTCMRPTRRACIRVGTHGRRLSTPGSRCIPSYYLAGLADHSEEARRFLGHGRDNYECTRSECTAEVDGSGYRSWCSGSSGYRSWVARGSNAHDQNALPKSPVSDIDRPSRVHTTSTVMNRRPSSLSPPGSGLERDSLASSPAHQRPAPG